MATPKVIRLHLLGALRLDADGAVPRRSVLAQPKRMALLAYLALRARRGPERRDTLLGLFWPESDTNHARGALRNALHFLRVSLGPEAVRSHGSEEVQVDLERVWCDAAEFERCCDEHDFAAALRLYGGDLLQGFFITGVPQFEHWLEAERGRLRQRAVEAARTLAADAESTGERHLATLRLREVLNLAPTDEDAARRLMGLLAEMDDRGEALRVYDDLCQRLDHEYGLEVASATRALAEQIRSAAPDVAHARHSDSAYGALDAGATGESSSEAAAATQTEGGVPQPPGRARFTIRPLQQRMKLLLALGAATVLVAVAVVMLYAPGGGPSADVVAVLPFEYRGSAEHAHLGEGLADLLAANLHGAGDLQAVDPRELLPGLRAARQPLAPAAARREAAARGAALFVLGSVTEAAGQLRIAAALYGPAHGDAEAADVVAEGSVDDILTLIDRVTLGLLQRAGATTFTQAALRTTTSVDAIRGFLRGEAALRRYAVQDAIEHYRHATQLDSTFALAHYRLSSAAYRWGISGVPAPAAAAALRHAGRLPREDSLLVAAWYNHVKGRAASAHKHYLEALHNRGTHVEAAFQLGELRFHWGAAIGLPASSAREPFTRVLAAEPHNTEAAVHLARIAARDGRVEELDSLAELIRSGHPAGSWIHELDLMRAFMAPDTAAQQRAVAQAGSSADWMLESVAAYTGNLAAVERVLASRLHLERDPGAQARTQLFLAHVQLGRGRYAAAHRTITEATALPAARRVEYSALMAGLPFLPLSRDELLASRAAIAAYPDSPLGVDGLPTSARGVEYPHVLWPGMFRERRLYLLAALHVRLDDAAAATTVADSLALTRDVEGFAEVYERVTRARVDALTASPTAALRTLGLPRDPLLGTFENFVDHARPYERWLRAELLRESGRVAEALQWYGTFPDPAARDLAFLAPSHLRRAEIHDAAGNHRLAAVHYRHFVDLWRNADPALQPQVTSARERLRTLAML